MMHERRDFERLLFSSSIRYQQKGLQRFSKSIGRDISNSGIGFVSSEFFPISTDLIFELRHPKTQDYVKAVGRVVWISNLPHSDRFSVGARFIGPPLTL